MTGGLAITDLKYQETSTVLFVPAQVEAAGFSKTRTGWTAGGGVEGRLMQRLTLKLEYLYADFGLNSVQGTVTNCVPNCSFNHQVKTTSNIVRLGVNYKLW